MSLANLNSMFDRESARTKSECLSEASTLLSTSVVKEKERMIETLEVQLTNLQSIYQKQADMLLTKTAEAAQFKALAEARTQQVEEAKATATMWHELADTLRKDQKELIAMWNTSN